MDPKFYQNLVDYLNYEKLPEYCDTAKKQKRFKTLSKQYHIQRGLLYKHMKNGTSNLVVLHYQLETILWMLHNDPTGAHFGERAVFEKARTRYYWPQMYEDIKTYVKNCEPCQLGKAPTKNSEIHPIITGEPFERVGIDFVGPLPETAEGNRYIIVAIDYFSKWPEARAVKEHNAITTARFIYEDIICRHGICEHLHSDRGTEFVNSTIEHLTRKFGIKHTKSTPYYPQANGQVERFNRTLVNSLRKMTEGQKDWDEFIAPTLFAYRTTPQTTTKISPFMITYGREARLPIDKPNTDGDFHDRIYQLIEEVPHIRLETKEAIRKGAEQMISSHKGGTTPIFEVGQEVSYWDAPKAKQFSRKLEPKRKGPYWIEDVLPNGAYRIRDKHGILKNPVNGKWLKLFNSKQSTTQPQIIIDDPIPTVYKDWVSPYLPRQQF
jgi:Integrase zinc binding domain/Integrase core domain